MSEATKTMVNNDFSDVVFNRHSVRKFDPTVKISRDEIQAMLTEAAKAPSACNLQSWHFVVIDTPEAKEKFKKAVMPFNYPQVDSASAIVFIAGDTQSHLVYRDVWNQVYQAGNITKERLDQILGTFLPLYEKATPEFLQLDATMDCSIVGMQLLLMARAHGYDANAFSGIDFANMIPTLGLDPKRYVPVMGVAIGKAAEEPLHTERYATTTQTEFL
ncbi:nitroreductase family protein [Lactiplantibacillus mudanjiangensis]|uniref:Nitroreductase [Lactobacillus plantarum JDM1] n=1 Tax=Lactiplantibacillus mudanjiangensis TaxID=1296538 RepID=A0A660DUU8_9LACO|nr:nitroreductase family protein [Lactiplantibacillus mudanjiangensis]VDG20964.1 nitroreductase [Lactobacillus plantarum JDM1] [Lactiplantibacillus mudanjiangensis]VDG22747.1 nitroreductase [Lactobacillus plantarum JDM1] [Lactiplantibacillus mudanjiangensis]VDG26686.1 nitroreductase [Lactobacillus plantarum JDM1] [Lactiplantibacillus mudanjiangensis]VDG31915.1 nitroreductase [Lactobacillus plantarum JDM1] [Lactiplantibacillus mudanjiangensis]